MQQVKKTSSHQATNVETSRQTSIEIKIPREHVTAIIGRGGAKIKSIQTETQTHVHFNADVDSDLPYRICNIRGKPENIRLAENYIRSIIANQPLIETYERHIPARFTGALIGRGGQNIMKIQRNTNSKITVINAATAKNAGSER